MNKSFGFLLIAFIFLMACDSSSSTDSATTTPSKEEMQNRLDELTIYLQDNPSWDTDSIVVLTEVYGEFTAVFPDDDNVPFYLQKQAQYFSMLGLHQDAINSYQIIDEKYAEAENHADAIFMMAFISKESLNDLEAARSMYETFLAQYPYHELADDAQFSLETLYMSDDELIDYIINKNQAAKEGTIES